MSRTKNPRHMQALIVTGVMAGLLPLTAAFSADGKIGSIMPLSGPAATYGQSFTNVIPLAQEQLKEEGVDLEVVSEDGAADVPASIAAYNKLVRVDEVSAIVHAVSPVVLALGPMGEKDEVVLVNSMAGSPKIIDLGEYTFSTMPSYQIEGTDAAKFAYENGARRVATLYQDTAAGRAAWDVFKPKFLELGGEVVAEEPYEAGATEFRAHLTRAKRENPDWIYLSSYAAETGRILAQAHRMGMTGKVQFLGIVGAAQKETIEIGGQGAEGFIHAAWPFDPENGTDAMTSFGADYKERYGSLPSVYAATSYDAIVALGRAFKAGATTGPEIQTFLAEGLSKMNGVSGEWSFDDKGMVGLETRFVRIENGERVNVE